MKCSFFQAAVVSILLYGCTTWTLAKRLEKKLDGNYTRMLRVILYKSWRQHPAKHQLYSHLPSITKTIQVRRTRHAGHCWRSRDEVISDVLLWTPTYGRAKAGRPARTYIQQLCADTGCNPEDLLEAMNDRVKWRERVRDTHASGTTWWWWCYNDLLLRQAQWTSFGTRPVKSASFELEISFHFFKILLLYQLPRHAIFFDILVLVINHYQIKSCANKLNTANRKFYLLSFRSEIFGWMYVHIDRIWR